MQYVKVHKKDVEWDGKELGLYLDVQEGCMPVGYFITDGEKIAGVANGMHPLDAIAGAERMLARAKALLVHKDVPLYPERFRNGIENSAIFYQALIDALKTV